MKKSSIKISWPNNIETYASEGDDWFSTDEKAGLEIPTGCLTGSCGACEIDVNGETRVEVQLLAHIFTVSSKMMNGEHNI